MHVASTTLRQPGWQCSTMALGRPGGQLQGPALCRSLLPITRNLVKAGRLKSAGWILLSFLWVSFVWGCMMIGAVFEGFTVYVYIYKYILAHIYYSAYIYIYHLKGLFNNGVSHLYFAMYFVHVGEFEVHDATGRWSFWNQRSSRNPTVFCTWFLFWYGEQQKVVKR